MGARWDDAAKTHFALICVSPGHTTPPRPAPQATFATRSWENVATQEPNSHILGPVKNLKCGKETKKLKNVP